MKKRKNPYDYKYVMIRDKCSEDIAKQKIQDLKNKTSGSKEAFIKRYGEVEGLKRFEEFSKKSAHTEESFKKKYGNNWKEEWKKYIKSKDSMSEEFHKNKYGNNWKKELESRKQSVSQSLQNNVEKYGVIVGTKKFKEGNEKRSCSCSTEGLITKYGLEKALDINNSKSCPGSKNGMYGKPSPKGSGNGWSGWYKGYHFRSILELSYIKYLIESKIEFKSAEQKQYVVHYKFNGNDRTYRADFVVGGDIIEIKPKKLINTKQNKAKFEAAKNKFGANFKVLTEFDFPVIESICDLVESGKVKLMKRYQNKYDENYKY